MESLQQFWIPGHKLCAVGLLKVHHNGALGECHHNGALGESGSMQPPVPRTEDEAQVVTQMIQSDKHHFKFQRLRVC